MRGSTAAKLLLSCLALCGVIWSASQLARHPSRLRATIGGRFACFSPDGEAVATEDEKPDGSIWFRIWDVATGRERALLASPFTRADEVIFSNDNNFLAARGTFEVRLWNIPESKEIALLPDAHGSHELHTIVFSPDGKLLAVEMAAEIQLVRTETGQTLSTLPGWLATSAFAPSGSSIAFVKDEDSILKLWDLTPGHAPRECNARGRIVGVAFAPNGQAIAALAQMESGLLELRLWNAHALDEMAALTVGQYTSERLYFSPDSRLLVALLHGDAGVTAIVWNLQAQRPRQVFEFRRTIPEFTRDGALMAASDWWAGQAELWSTTTFQKVASFRWSNRSFERDELVVHWMKLSPDGKFYAAAAVDNTEPRGTAAVVEQIVERIGFTSGNPWTTRLWDTTTGKELLRFDRDSILAPDGRTLLTQSEEIQLWEMPPQWPMEYVSAFLLSTMLLTICLIALGRRRSTVTFPR
jgi:WD40 repeat protein